MSDETGVPVEIVTVGRELVAGHVVDTNAAWLANRLPALGGRVVRIVTVDDDPPAIAREIRHARTSGTPLVVTTGGLGPTFDDRTLAGVAAALGRPLREHPAALSAVARRYAELAGSKAVDDPTLTPARRKQACLPDGADFVDNPVGTAPGVLLATPSVVVCALPGIPAEMRAVFEAAAPRLAARLGAPVFRGVRELASGCGDESRLTALAERVMAAHPGVHVKSLPTEFSPDCDLTIRLTSSAATPGEAEQRVAAAATLLGSLLAARKE
jgi:molybdenum cofactor synthesis domain-containing protein